MRANHFISCCKMCARTLTKLALPAMAVVLFGCETTPQIRDVNAPVAGKALVFGTVQVFEDGKPKTWGMKWTGIEEFSLLILPPGASRAAIYQLAADGNFTWGLAPGEYTIAGYKLTKGRGFRSGRIWARFSVPPGASSVYVGDLKMSVVGRRVAIGIHDDYEAAVEQYRAKYSRAADVPHKALMVPEDPVGSFEDITYICAEEWGIQCNKKYNGIEPVQPDAGAGSFSQVSSLAPQFEWHPSSSDDVSYDLVIYEAIDYSHSGLDKQYMKGGVAVYEEGLKSSTWQLRLPLKANQNYFWSVRLRRGNVVSNWSTYSHFEFYVVAWSSGYGEWFGFSTPAGENGGQSEN